VSFFDDAEAPPPAPPPDYRTPEWLAPPENVRPATVALDLVLVRRPDLAIWVSDALAYPAGLTFGVNVQTREARREPASPFFGETDAGEMRFGLMLADGRKVITQRLGDMRPFLDRPDRPILRPRSGSGGSNRSSAELWLWPLPPAGPLTFVLAWPAEGIDETSVETDATPIVAAAERAFELWPDDRPLPPSEDDVVI